MTETLKMALHIMPAILPSTILVYLLFLPLSLEKLLEYTQGCSIIGNPFLTNTSFEKAFFRKRFGPKRTRAILYLIITSFCYAYFLLSKTASNEEAFATVRYISLKTLSWSFEIALLLVIFGVILRLIVNTSDGIQLLDAFWLHYIQLTLIAIRIVQLSVVTLISNWMVIRYLAWFPYQI